MMQGQKVSLNWNLRAKKGSVARNYRGTQLTTGPFSMKSQGATSPLPGLKGIVRAFLWRKGGLASGPWRRGGGIINVCLDSVADLTA